MAAIAATDLTYTIERTDKTPGKMQRSRVKIVFGDGALTYPSGGVPLTAGKMGCPNYVNAVTVVDSDDASGIVWKWDAANNKLRGYIQGVVVSAAGAATLDDFAINTTTEPLATAVSLGLDNAQGAGTKYLGKLIELTTTQAPAAQTMYVIAEGW